jgi:hypothetical protein
MSYSLRIRSSFSRGGGIRFVRKEVLLGHLADIREKSLAWGQRTLAPPHLISFSFSVFAHSFEEL